MKRREAIRNTAIFLGAASIASATALMQSCKPDLTDTWKAEFLSMDQVNLLSEIAETILPKTDTPGAKDAKVSRYLDQYVSRFMKPEEQEKYKQALTVFDAFSQKLFTKSFVNISNENKANVLQAMIDDPSEGESSPSEIFNQIRSVVNMAFFSSEIGATQVLDYIPIPGDYQGDIPINSTKGLVYSG